MNAIQQAKASTAELTDLLTLARQARAAFAARSLHQGYRPDSTQAYISGKGMVRVIDSTSHRVLGFRRTAKEAAWLQQALESGAHLPANQGTACSAQQ